MGCDDNHLLLAAVTKISLIWKQNCYKQRDQFLLQPRLLPMQMAPPNCWKKRKKNDLGQKVG